MGQWIRVSGSGNVCLSKKVVGSDHSWVNLSVCRLTKLDWSNKLYTKVLVYSNPYIH